MPAAEDFHPPLTFNDNIVYQTISQKLILDNRFSFEENLLAIGLLTIGNFLLHIILLSELILIMVLLYI